MNTVRQVRGSTRSPDVQTECYVTGTSCQLLRHSLPDARPSPPYGVQAPQNHFSGTGQESSPHDQRKFTVSTAHLRRPVMK